MVNGEKNVKAGTVGGNSSFLELLSSDCVKTKVVSLDKNFKGPNTSTIQLNRNSTMENSRSNEEKNETIHYIPGSVGGKTSAPPMSNTPLKDIHQI